MLPPPEDVTDEGGDNSEESENGSEEGEMDEESGDEEDGEEDYSNDSCGERTLFASSLWMWPPGGL